MALQGNRWDIKGLNQEAPALPPLLFLPLILLLFLFLCLLLPTPHFLSLSARANKYSLSAGDVNTTYQSDR
jgi:hypothetical protein